ncbi:MAG: hypothetical protein L0Z62_17270 [Gemmataceae bacterium]|nr:hypothetical protein [Gemmataceae bacterium]
MARANGWILATILLIGSLHLLALRPGHEWGDDFSLYVAHARNLAEGRAYADTGYVYNPHFPSLSPRTYPPVFPLLLAPVYLVFGMNLTAMKVFVIVLFLAFLWVFALTLRGRLPLPYTLACLVLVGLNPAVWQLKDRLLSEMPFLLFAYLALFLMEKARQAEGSRWAWVWGVLAGLTAYLAFGTRTVGVVLVPALLARQVLLRRRLGLVGLLFLGTFAAGVAVEKALLSADGSYLDQLVFDPALYARIGLSLVRALELFLDNGYSAGLRGVLFLCLAGLAVPAYWLALSRRPTVYEPFAAFSCLLLVFWPCAEWNQRFLLPILPLFALYAAEGVLLAASRFGLCGRLAAAALALAVTASCAACHTRLENGPPAQGVHTPDAVALFDFVKTQTGPGDVFVVAKPRVFALYTGRPASAPHTPPSPEHLGRYLEQIHATHLVIGEEFHKSRAVLQAFVEENPTRVEQVYRNRAFTVFRLRNAECGMRIEECSSIRIPHSAFRNRKVTPGSGSSPRRYAE